MLHELLLLKKQAPSKQAFLAFCSSLDPVFTDRGINAPWGNGSILPGNFLHSFYKSYEYTTPQATAKLVAHCAAKPRTRGFARGLLTLTGRTVTDVPTPSTSYRLSELTEQERLELPAPLLRLHAKINHISFEVFQELLWFSAQKLFAAIGNDNYILVVGDPNKSSAWTTKVFLNLVVQTMSAKPHAGFRLPEYILQDSYFAAGQSVLARRYYLSAEGNVAYESEVAAAATIAHAVYVDDCSYTGIQLENKLVRELPVRASRRHVVLAAIGSRNRLLEGATAIVHCCYYLPELASIFTSAELATLIQLEQEVYQRWDDMQSLQLEIRPRYLVYFDHKLADSTSVPTGLIASFIEGCDYDLPGLSNERPYCPPQPYARVDA